MVWQGGALHILISKLSTYERIPAPPNHHIPQPHPAVQVRHPLSRCTALTGVVDAETRTTMYFVWPLSR